MTSTPEYSQVRQEHELRAQLTRIVLTAFSGLALGVAVSTLFW